MESNDTNNAPPADARTRAEDLAEVYYDVIADEGGPTFKDLRSTPTFYMRRQDEGRQVDALATCKLYRSLAPLFFTHQYDSQNPQLLGAKGLVIADRRNVRYEALIWRTGSGQEGLNFHHRDALAFAKRVLLEDWKKKRVYLETMGLMNKGDFPKWQAVDDEGNFLDTTVDFPALNQEIVEITRQVEAMVNEEADSLSAHRKVKTFTDDDLQITLGFQFTAIDQGKDGLQIVHLDVDSSITSASLEREADREAAAVVQMVVAMINAIDPKLLAFKHAVRAKLPVEQIHKLNEVAQAHCTFRFRQLPT